MDRLVFILDDIDDLVGLLQQGLGRSGVLAICLCVVLTSSAALVAGWRGLLLSVVASGLIVALAPLTSSARN